MAKADAKQEADREGNTGDEVRPEPPIPKRRPASRVVLGTYALAEVERNEKPTFHYSMGNTTFGEVPRPVLGSLQGQKPRLEQGHLQKLAVEHEQDVERCMSREQEQSGNKQI